MTPFTINSATESDVPILLAMIRELAEFERLAHEVEVTADSLRAALFGERPVAAALLARMDDFPAGYAVYYHTFSTFVGRPGIFLDDIYVRPEFRKRGILVGRPFPPMNDYLRVSVGNADEMARFLAAFKEILPAGGGAAPGKTG